MYLGSWKIDDYVPIPVTCHRFSSGAAYQPTALTYSIYEDVTAAGIDEDVNVAADLASPFDGIVGFYLTRRQLTTAAGFEKGKNYTIVIKATIDSVAMVFAHTFQIAAGVDVCYWDGGVVEEPTVPGMPSVNSAYAGGEAISLAAQLDANVVQWQGAEVQASHEGCPEVCAVNEVLANVTSWDGQEVVEPTVSGVPNVNVTNWDGGVVEEPTVPGMPSVNAAYAGGEAVSIAAQVDSNVVQWQGAEVSAGSDGYPYVNAVLANVTSIYNDEESAIDMSLAAATVVRGEATGIPNNTAMPTNLTVAVDSYYDDRVVVWTSGVVKDVARIINSYSATGDITYDALPGALAPVAGDGFVIV